MPSVGYGLDMLWPMHIRLPRREWGPKLLMHGGGDWTVGIALYGHLLEVHRIKHPSVEQIEERYGDR